VVSAPRSPARQTLRSDDILVRAFVRKADQRSAASPPSVRTLTRPPDVVQTLAGCESALFAMAVSASYVEAALTFIAAVRAQEGPALRGVLNFSQLTAKGMSVQRSSASQQRAHWLVEQAWQWSGLPVVPLRATVLCEHPFFLHVPCTSVMSTGGCICL
jgi:NAD(P)H dehydrogenase (quinone)